MTTSNKIRLMFWVIFSGLCTSAYIEGGKGGWIAVWFVLSLLVLSNCGKEERYK